MKIGIIGAGLIGKKRAASLNDSYKLYYACDINKPLAKSLAKQYSALYTCKVQDLIKNDEIETVIISVVSLKAGENDRILVFFAGHDETGYLVNIDDDERMAQYICSLAKDIELRKKNRLGGKKNHSRKI